MHRDWIGVQKRNSDVEFSSPVKGNMIRKSTTLDLMFKVYAWKGKDLDGRTE
jgi:hypothetical protein